MTTLKVALETQSTHSTDCYKWHHKCAIAEVERLRLLCEEMLSELYVYRASKQLKDVTAAIRARGETNDRERKVKKEFVGLTLAEMDKLIDGNITITDPRLRDAVYAVVLDTMHTLMEKNGYDDYDEAVSEPNLHA